MQIRRRDVLIGGTLALALAACGAEETGSGGDDLGVTVSEDTSAPPEITFEPPLEAPDSLQSRVIVEGDGEVPADGEVVVYEFVQKNGSDGSVLYSSYEAGQRATMPLDPAQIGQALYDAVSGLALGSRVLIIQPYEDPESQETVPQVVVLDLVDTILDRATGVEQEPDPALPTYTLAEDGAPVLGDIPDTAPPEQTVTHVAIEGEGPEVEAGQTIFIHYTGWKWSDGTVFDSSWERGQPASFPIGVGQLIAGWDETIPGHTVGSQLELVIPPADSYGGSEGHELADETLIFVVDILYAL